MQTQEENYNLNALSVIKNKMSNIQIKLQDLGVNQQQKHNFAVIKHLSSQVSPANKLDKYWNKFKERKTLDQVSLYATLEIN